MQQLYVPEGFAHGFLVLSDVADVLYKVRGAGYEPTAERGLRWDDPSLAIDWGIEAPILSQRDRRWPLLGRDATRGATMEDEP
jgi:dTDP-4-dehydrorhamnose 3,5-epimerase